MFSGFPAGSDVHKHVCTATDAGCVQFSSFEFRKSDILLSWQQKNNVLICAFICFSNIKSGFFHDAGSFVKCV